MEKVLSFFNMSVSQRTKRWFFQNVVEDPDRLAPSPNPIQHLTRAQTVNPHWSKSDCTHVYLFIYLFMAEWHQMPAVSFQNLGVETVVAACLMIRGGTACSVIKYWHNICTLFICVFHLPAHRCPLRTNTRHSHMFHIQQQNIFIQLFKWFFFATHHSCY